jgi:hypothetical protein
VCRDDDDDDDDNEYRDSIRSLVAIGAVGWTTVCCWCELHGTVIPEGNVVRPWQDDGFKASVLPADAAAATAAAALAE